MLRLVLEKLRRPDAPSCGRVRPARDVLTAEKDGVAVLLDLKRAVYFSLDEAGTTAWREIERSSSAESVAARICEEYDAPQDAVLADVERFIGELRRERLVVTA